MNNNERKLFWKAVDMGLVEKPIKNNEITVNMEKLKPEYVLVCQKASARTRRYRVAVYSYRDEGKSQWEQKFG